jgi:hypothetical protein
MEPLCSQKDFAATASWTSTKPHNMESFIDTEQNEVFTHCSPAFNTRENREIARSIACDSADSIYYVPSNEEIRIIMIDMECDDDNGIVHDPTTGEPTVDGLCKE